MNQKIGIAVDTEKDNDLSVTNITSDGLVISFREQAADSLSGYSSIKIEISSTRSSTKPGRSVVAVSTISLQLLPYASASVPRICGGLEKV